MRFAPFPPPVLAWHGHAPPPRRALTSTRRFPMHRPELVPHAASPASPTRYVTRRLAKAQLDEDTATTGHLFDDAPAGPPPPKMARLADMETSCV